MGSTIKSGRPLVRFVLVDMFEWMSDPWGLWRQETERLGSGVHSEQAAVNEGSDDVDRRKTLGLLNDYVRCLRLD